MPFVSVFEGKRLVMFCMNNRYSDTSDDAFAPSSASCAFKSNNTVIASSAVLAAGLLSVIIAAFAALKKSFPPAESGGKGLPAEKTDITIIYRFFRFVNRDMP